MEAVNDALKLIANAREILSKTDFTDTRDNLPGAAYDVERLLEQAIDKLASSST